MAQSDGLMAQLLAAFAIESEENFGVISSGLVELEHLPAGEARTAQVESVYRAFHSLKGAARAVDLRNLESVCQAAESIFAAVKRDAFTLSRPVLDILHDSVDAMRESLDTESGAAAGSLQALRARLLGTLADAATGAAMAPPAAAPVQTAPSAAYQSAEPAPKPARAVTFLSFGSNGAKPRTNAPSIPSASPLPLEPEAIPPASPPRLEAIPPPSPIPVHASQTAGEPVLDETRVDRSGAASPSIDRGAPRRTVTTGPSPAGKGQETIKVAADRLDSVLLQVEEMLSLKLAAAHHASRMQEVKGALGMVLQTVSAVARDLRQEGVGRPGLTRLQELLDASRTSLKNLDQEVAELGRLVGSDARQLEGQIDQLLDDSKRLLMLPIGTLLQTMPKMVRDVARDLGKDVVVDLAGTDIEMDKRIIDALRDPLVHIVRNCIDHGIEMPEKRVARGKAPAGSIAIRVRQIDSQKVEVEISDDGGGIDIDRLKRVAVTNGVLSADAATQMDKSAAAELIFESGLSTSAMITDLSGRGLGMAIARDAVEQIGGVVAVETALGAGTTFRLILPTSHTTLRCVLIRLGQRRFLVPAPYIERVARLRPEEIRSAAHCDSLLLDGRSIAVVSLADVLGLPRAASGDGHGAQFVALRVGETRVAFLVEEILYEQETLVKQLGSHLQHVRHFSGAAVLGAGEPVPILNPRDLIASVREAGTGRGAGAQSDVDKTVRPRKILVVEDSITSRILIKNILEAVGYEVVVAVDGTDGLASLRNGPVDLVVSDIEMPRMDGLLFTETLRKDPQFADLPVILVTSLESQEHRERGVRACANAYIVKRTFDQGNLLETVQRLLS